MNILLISATKAEINFIKDLPKEVDVLIAGVGVPSTIYHLQKKMQQVKYDLIIQAGIAGTFDNSLKLGEVVLVTQDIFADIGMEQKNEFTSIFQTTFTDKNEFPFDDGWLKNNHAIARKKNIQQVTGVTVSKVSDSQLQKQQLIKNFSPGIESMEGAALHYVCLQEHIPFVQIRAISNEVGERDKTKWKMKEAIDNLGIGVLQLINDARYFL